MPDKWTKEYLKKESLKLYGDLYSFDRTLIIGRNILTTITCNIHGDFSKSPQNFLEGSVCPQCRKEKDIINYYWALKTKLYSKYSYDFKGLIYFPKTKKIYFTYKDKNWCYWVSNILKTNNPSFLKDSFKIHIEHCKKIHNNFYDYSLLKGTEGLRDKIEIICPLHGPFKVPFYQHKAGSKCWDCSYELRSKSKIDKFSREYIAKVSKLHQGKYDYSKTIYKGTYENVIVICPNHGEFPVRAGNHLNSLSGCPKCSEELDRSLVFDVFKKAAFKRNKGKAYLYVLRCFNNKERFYKVGITTKKISLRFAGKDNMPYQYEVISLLFINHLYAWNLEKSLHRWFKKYRYHPEIAFPGSKLECYSIPSEKEFLLKGKRLKKLFELNPFYYSGVKDE